MNVNTISVVENWTAENNNVLDSNPDVEISPIATRKRRRMILLEVQDDDDENLETMADWATEDLYIDGSYTKLSCPSLRLLWNYKQRYIHGDLYSMKENPVMRATLENVTGSQRVRTLLECRAMNGDLLYTREHLHYSLLTARPILWRRLMLLINKACPGMYTPADEPLISSYKFGVGHLQCGWYIKDRTLKRFFPCMQSYVGAPDGTRNHWFANCQVCRNQPRNRKIEKCNQITFAKEMVHFRQILPELHVRDVAMKWAYVARRLVCGIWCGT